MNSTDQSTLSVPKRCIGCDRPYVTTGIGNDVLMRCPGGICLGCGKPAVADFAQAYMSHLDQRENIHEQSSSM
jgi:hypothetical protein